MSNPSSSLGQAFAERASARLSVLAIGLGSQLARLLVLFVAVVVTGYWIFITIWSPLFASVPLPAEVNGVNPAIDLATLQRVDEQRRDRIDTVQTDFVVSGIITPGS